MNMDALIEISQEATLEASKALSKFVNVPVSLGTTRVEVRNDLALSLDADKSEPVYAISGEIVGDAKGFATLSLPLKTACGLSDLLFKREIGTTRTIAADEQDALLELGNIVVGNYLRAFARAMPGKTFVHKTAGMFCDAWTNLTKRLETAYNSEHSRDALLFEVSFNFRHAALAGCVMIVLDANCVRHLMECALTA